MKSIIVKGREIKVGMWCAIPKGYADAFEIRRISDIEEHEERNRLKIIFNERTIIANRVGWWCSKKRLNADKGKLHKDDELIVADTEEEIRQKVILERL